MDKADGTLPDRRHDCQRRQQVRAAGDVDLPVPRAGQPPIEAGNSQVSLGRKGVESLNLHRASKKISGIPKGCLRPVRLHSPCEGAVGGGKDFKAPQAGFFRHRDPRLAHGLHRHGDVLPGLDLRGA